MSDQAKNDKSTDERANERKRIKVTDRRMFTPEGNLREEFKDLKDAAAPQATAEARAEAGDQGGRGGPQPAAPRQSSPLAGPAASGPSASSASGAAREKAPGGDVRGPGGGKATRPSGPVAAPSGDEEDESATGAGFYDLVAMLAQTASVYLNQAAQQLDQRAELLEMARMHIDLLTVLEKKTRGNLEREEKAMLDDAIYRLRMAFVEIGG